MNNSKLSWVIEGQLARSCRPGYPAKAIPADVVRLTVRSWLDAGIRSVICLLAEEQLAFYSGLPDGLLAYYRDCALEVAHIPVTDYKQPPLNSREEDLVLQAFIGLPKPLLIHCSAGIDRTGAAIRKIMSTDFETHKSDLALSGTKG